MRKPVLTLTVVFLSACAAKPMMQGAEKIFVSESEPRPECIFVGEVQGTQGNFITADFTSDLNLLTGARNEMRNQALELGANYVVLETQSHSHNTSVIGLGGTYSSVVFGNAYRCPPESLKTG